MQKFIEYSVSLGCTSDELHPIMYKIADRENELRQSIEESIEHVRYMDSPNIAAIIHDLATSNHLYFITGEKAFVDARTRFSCIHQTFKAIVCASNEMECFGILYGTHDLEYRYMLYKQNEPIYTIENVLDVAYDKKEILFYHVTSCSTEDGDYCPEYYCREEISV